MGTPGRHGQPENTQGVTSASRPYISSPSLPYIPHQRPYPSCVLPAIPRPTPTKFPFLSGRPGLDRGRRRAAKDRQTRRRARPALSPFARVRAPWRASPALSHTRGAMPRCYRRRQLGIRIDFELSPSHDFNLVGLGACALPAASLRGAPLAGTPRLPGRLHLEISEPFLGATRDSLCRLRTVVFLDGGNEPATAGAMPCNSRLV